MTLWGKKMLDDIVLDFVQQNKPLINCLMSLLCAT